MKITRCARFENPANGYVLECHSPSLFALLCGPLSLCVWGMWLPGLALIVLTAGTFGLFWLVLPLIATKMLRQHYMIAGWRELPAEYYYLWGRPAASPTPRAKVQLVASHAAKSAAAKPLMSEFEEEPPRYQL